MAAILHIFKSSLKIQSTVDPQIPVCSGNSFTVKCLSSSMQCSTMATDMSVSTDTACPLWCMSAAATLPLPNASAHPATVWYSMALSPSASCHSAWHSTHLFHTEGYFQAQTLSHITASISERERYHSEVGMWSAVYSYTHTPSDGNIYRYMPGTFKHVYTISCVATFCQKKKNVPWLMEWPTYVRFTAQRDR
jgi:hypothetical protein